MNTKTSLIASVLLALLLAACGGDGKPTSSASTRAAQNVAVFTVQSAQSDATERVPGSIQSISSTTLEAKVSGRVDELLVREGSRVKSGQVLVKLGAKEIDARLAQALAAERQAQQDLERFRKLLPAHAVTQQDFDSAEARAAMTAAGVAEARTMVGYATIQAPFDGVVTKKFIEPGDLAMPGKPLLAFEREDLFRFEADIPESAGGEVAIGSELTIVIPGINETMRGVVSEMSPTMDPNSRTRHVKIDLPKRATIQSGQFGYVNVRLGTRKTIRIPASAVLRRGQLELVFVASNGAALLRLVRTGKELSGEVEILSGLEDGEQIIREGLDHLRDGDRIEVRP